MAHAQWRPIFTLQGLPGDAPAETRQAWAALLPPDFVEGLWQQLQGLWVHMAFCRPHAAAPPAQAAAPVAAAQSPGECSPPQTAVPAAAETSPDGCFPANIAAVPVSAAQASGARRHERQGVTPCIATAAPAMQRFHIHGDALCDLQLPGSIGKATGALPGACSLLHAWPPMPG